MASPRSGLVVGVVSLLAALAVVMRYVPLKQRLIAQGLSAGLAAGLLIAGIVALVVIGVQALRRRGRDRAPYPPNG